MHLAMHQYLLRLIDVPTPADRQVTLSSTHSFNGKETEAETMKMLEIKTIARNY